MVKASKQQQASIMQNPPQGQKRNSSLKSSIYSVLRKWMRLLNKFSQKKLKKISLPVDSKRKKYPAFCPTTFFAHVPFLYLRGFTHHRPLQKSPTCFLY